MATTPDADPFSFLQDARKPSPEMDTIERPEPDAGDENLKEQVMAALKTVRDPEIPVNLVDLGLIYELIVRKDGLVYVEMTLTTPACPVAGVLPRQVRAARRATRPWRACSPSPRCPACRRRALSWSGNPPGPRIA